MSNGRRRSLALGASAALAFSAAVFSPVWAAPRLTPAPDLSEDAQDAMDDALLATPNPVTPAPLANLIATAPDLEAQAPSPQFRANALLPPGWELQRRKIEPRWAVLGTMAARRQAFLGVAARRSAFARHIDRLRADRSLFPGF